MALVRVYCGLASAEPTGRPAIAGTGLTAAVVDDAGRLLDVCEITDDPAGYAQLGARLAERANGPGSAAIAADSDDHEVTSLLSAAGRPLAIADDDAVDDFAERFADDESLEEMESPAAERRAVGLARALQAGAIFAVGLPVPRDLVPFRPVLAAHSALAGGRHAAAATLREVLRELYPAALRAYSDPAEPLALAVLDALPEAGMLSGPTARGRDLPVAAEAVAKRLAAEGAGDLAAVTEAITALRVAISETPRRGTVNKSLASASAEAVRQAVAAVRSCDEGCAALVATLAERTTPLTAVPRRPVRRAAVADTTETTEPAATPAGLHALPLPLPDRSTGRRHRPEPAAAATTPRALTTPPVAPAPVTPPPTAPTPVSTTAAAPFAEPARPAEPQRAGNQSRPPNAPRHPAASRSASRSAEPRTPTRAAEAPRGIPPVRSTEPLTPPRTPRPPAITPPAALANPTPANGTPMPSRSPGHAWSTGFDGTSRYEPTPTSAPPQPPTPATLQPPTPVSPAASTTTPLPGRPVSAGPANKPVSVPPPPPGITPIPAQRPTAPTLPTTQRPTTPTTQRPAAPAAQRPSVPPAEAGEPFRATLTNAAINSARAERKRPTVIPPRANGRNAPTPPPEPPVTGFQATDLSVPVPAPRPEPGARANWPLVDNTSDDRANGEPRFPDLSELPPSELDRPTYSPVGDDRVTPPWLADDMPPEPPILRLVEPPPLADRALRDDSPRETRSRSRAAERSSDYAARYETPPLRLVDTTSDTGSHQLPIGISAPPVSEGEGDGDLLIFAAARSAWFTGHTEEHEDLSWSSVADTGWRAAEKASAPSIGLETQSGLPRRVPQANLVPGSPLREERPLRIVRDAASIAAHTTGYFRGWRRGQEIGGYAVGGRPGREAAGGWDFSRDHGGRDESQEYEYRSARS
ncbi:transposase [Asanoa siamensis]|uniref:transposase n=1 Tax=Asanoa siamensis TaxID=926357 RepID=UPI001EF1D1AD|nr:transposase [Asanoa siamensis]